MKVIIFACALVLYSTVATAQNGWRYIGPVDREIQSMAVHEDLILCVASTIGGDRLFRSTDAGRTWDTLATAVRQMAIIPDGNPTIVGSIPPNKDFMFSTDFGETWDTSATAPPGIWLNRMYVKSGTPNLIFAISGYGSFGQLERLYRSSDYGRTWSWPYPFPTSSDGSRIAVGLSPTTPDVYVSVNTDIGGAYFFHSSDDGVTWEFVAESPLDITTLLIDPDISGKIISFQYNKIMLSEDGGASWRTLHTGNANQRNFRSLIRSSEDVNELYLFVEPDIHRALPGWITFSNSGGQTWKDDSTSLSLPFKTVYRVFDPITWLQHDARRKRLYFQTERGIYIRENLSITYTEADLPISGGIQTYPQPASEGLIVKTCFPAHSGTTLRMYNTLGTLIQEWHVADSGSLHWDLRDRNNLDVPNGVYLLAAIAGKDVMTQRVVIQR